MKKHFFYIFFVLLFFSCEKNKTQMNVVVLFTDDQRFNTIHALGNEAIHTPNMDRLVKMGTSFTHAHVMGSHHGAVCAPSRAMLLSGRPYMNIPKAYIDQGMVPPETHFDFITFPELLRSKGYATFFTGKWHNNTSKIREGFEDGDNIYIGGMHFPKNGGHQKPQLWHFDSTAVFDKKNQWDAEKFSSEMYSDAAVNFIQQQTSENPFCLYVAYTSPHDPREAPSKFTKMYPPEKIELPKNFMPQHPFDNGHLRVRDENLAPFPRTESIIKKEIAAYYAMVSEVDAQIGRVLDELEEKGLMDNTIIVFAGDNGLAVGQHGLLGKQSVYDHSVRVPLVITSPKIRGNFKANTYCYIHDIFPTICELLDLEIPEGVEGKSLFSSMQDNAQIRDHLFLAHAKEMRAVRDNKNFKLIQNFAHGESREQLFNLTLDPWEMNNLADDPNFLEKKKDLKHLMLQNIQLYNDEFIQAHINLNQSSFDAPVEVNISSTFPEVEIRYTLNDEEPNASSALYQKSFMLEKSTPIKAAIFSENKKIGKTYFAEAKISNHIKDLFLSPLPSSKYTGKGKNTLLDGANGSEKFRTKAWIGYEGNDAVAIVELKKTQPIESVGVRYLHQPGSWIFSPKRINISISKDGKNYNSIAILDDSTFPNKNETGVGEVILPLENVDGKFIKFEIENQGVCPDWHPGKGSAAWLFLDELFVN